MLCAETLTTVEHRESFWRSRALTLLCSMCCRGYSLNALVDFPTTDPIEIIKRLMIGSEGTFGFVSQATYNTVPEWPNKVWHVKSLHGGDPPACSASSAKHRERKEHISFRPSKLITAHFLIAAVLGLCGVPGRLLCVCCGVSAAREDSC